MKTVKKDLLFGLVTELKFHALALVVCWSQGQQWQESVLVDRVSDTLGCHPFSHLFDVASNQYLLDLTHNQAF